MPTLSYLERRDQLERYFDRTAADAWARLTTDAPVGRIRATVRQGRTEMRNLLVDWLPDDLEGRRILDAGCGTGTLAVELANRGADVLAVDLSPHLIEVARERFPERVGKGRLKFQVGDMLTAPTERYDHVLAMDSLIHYDATDLPKLLGLLASASTKSLIFTFVTRTPVLVAMHAVGRIFPRSDRSPSLRPLGEDVIRAMISSHEVFAQWQVARTTRISRGFYTSQGMELIRQ